LNKKIIGLLIIILFILTSFNVLGFNVEIVDYYNNMLLNPSPDDVQDQHQKKHNYGAYGVRTTEDGLLIKLSQTFQPSLNILTRVKLWFRSGITEETIKVTIKRGYFEEELTSITRSFVSHVEGDKGWLEFDFPDIFVEPNETYHIICQPFGEPKYIYEAYTWYFWNTSEEPGIYDRGYILQDVDDWLKILEGDDACFITYGYYNENAYSDIESNGVFNWVDIKPGEVLNETIEIWNNGFNGTYLDWRITEWPDWGEWTFNPKDGKDLTHKDGIFSINISFKVPDVEEQNFSGYIRIINDDFVGDFEMIDVSLSTQKSKDITFSLFNLIKNVHSL